jgi:putative acetyltransferase
MIDLIRTNATDTEFAELVLHLNLDLRERYGPQQAFFDQFNQSDTIRHVIIARQAGRAVGCGAFRHFSDDTCEIKRMYVTGKDRGRGIGGKILAALETWAREEGYAAAVLETGTSQPEAIHVYERAGYKRIKNYPPYEEVALSVCMKKVLTD